MSDKTITSIEEGVNSKGDKYVKTTRILDDGQVEITVMFPDTGTGQVYLDGQIHALIGPKGDTGVPSPPKVPRIVYASDVESEETARRRLVKILKDYVDCPCCGITDYQTLYGGMTIDRLKHEIKVQIDDIIMIGCTVYPELLPFKIRVDTMEVNHKNVIDLCNEFRDALLPLLDNEKE